MINSFRCRKTAILYKGEFVKQFSAISMVARKKLRMIDAAELLQDLMVPPSNHLEKLTGDRKEQYSIRINAQWRICFEWVNGAAYHAEIVDYH